MLELMWPVYARGVAEDFLPALGSNPCEVRADARDDRQARATSRALPKRLRRATRLKSSRARVATRSGCSSAMKWPQLGDDLGRHRVGVVS